MKWRTKHFLHFILIILLALLIFLHPNSIGKAAAGTTVGGPGMPAALYLLLDEGIQQVTDYDNDSFDSSVDCNDQATSCTTDCTDEDGDAVSDCLDLCIDNDFDGYGIDNSASIIGNGSFLVSECTVYGSDPCILNEACYGSDCDDSNSDIYPTNTEVCDGLDNDCDPASSDGSEDPQDGAACDGSDSDLCEEGITSCVAGVLVCSDNSSSTLDVCNGEDDDCDPASSDGSEDPQDGAACDGSDSDLCEEGITSCVAGVLVCSDNSSSTLDVCNGEDDDCDPASSDGSEDPQDGAACDTYQSGACAAGTINCISGFLTCTANNSPSPEICDDGIDNDCDGMTDCTDTADCGSDPVCQVMPCNTYLDKKSCQDAGCTWSNKDKVCM